MEPFLGETQLCIRMFAQQAFDQLGYIPEPCFSAFMTWDLLLQVQGMVTSLAVSNWTLHQHAETRPDHSNLLPVLIQGNERDLQAKVQKRPSANAWKLLHKKSCSVPFLGNQRLIRFRRKWVSKKDGASLWLSDHRSVTGIPSRIAHSIRTHPFLLVPYLRTVLRASGSRIFLLGITSKTVCSHLPNRLQVSGPVFQFLSDLWVKVSPS